MNPSQSASAVHYQDTVLPPAAFPPCVILKYRVARKHWEGGEQPCQVEDGRGWGTTWSTAWESAFMEAGSGVTL